MSSVNFTRPDNVLISSSLCPALVHCIMAPEEWLARSDHMPIVTALSTAPVIQTEMPRPNYRVADWEVVRTGLALRLEALDAQEESAGPLSFSLTWMH